MQNSTENERKGGALSATPVVVRRYKSGVLAMLGIFALCGLALFGFSHSFDPPSAWQNPPIYSGTQEVRSQDFGKNGKDLNGGIFISKAITYTVSASPNEITSFYNDIYSRAGFRTDSVDSSKTTPGKLHFYTFGPGRSSAMYLVDIDSTQISTGSTEVTLKVSWDPGY